MEWTPQRKLKFFMALPWTVTADKDPDEGYMVVRVKELPSVIATGEPETAALEQDFWESLQATLEAALEFGDPVPLPKGIKAPWEHPVTPTPARNMVIDVSAPFYMPQPRVTGSPAAINPEPDLAVA